MLDLGQRYKLKRTCRWNREIEPCFFTLEQTAQYLNVSVQQVYSLVRSGELPGIKIGGRGVWRVGREYLEQYVERLFAETAGHSLP